MSNRIVYEFSEYELAAEIIKLLKPELLNELKSMLAPMKEPSNYLSKKEVSKKYKITVRTLSQWTKVGKVPAYRIGRRVLYKEADIDKALTVVKTAKSK